VLISDATRQAIAAQNEGEHTASMPVIVDSGEDFLGY
jgi:hypothetical protein